MITIYKGFQIKPHPHNPMSLVVAVDGKGGKIPAVLEGLFTSHAYAKRVIDTYVESRPNKEKVNGSKSNEEISTS